MPGGRVRGSAAAAGAATAPRPNTGAARRLARREATEALEPLAPVLDALRAARKPADLGRAARAVELYERALALADAAVEAGALPADSLLVTSVLRELTFARVFAAGLATATECELEARATAWRTDERALQLAQRLLGTLTARWHAGELFTLTPAERGFADEERQLEEDSTLPQRAVSDIYFMCASDAARWWPAGVLSDEQEEARVRGIAGALRALAQLTARSMAGGAALRGVNGRRSVRLFRLKHDVAAHLAVLLELVLDVDYEMNGRAPLLPALRSLGGLSVAEEQILRDPARPYVESRMGNAVASLASRDAALQARAAADVASHELRGCALPDCGAQEPHPKAFKLCSRCKDATYCCKEHQVEDWARHKREDGCQERT